MTAEEAAATRNDRVLADGGAASADDNVPADGGELSTDEHSLPADAPDEPVPGDEPSAHDGDDAGVRGWPAVGVVLAVLWLFVRGVEPAADALLGEFLFGLVVGMPTAYLFRRTFPDRVDPLHVVRVLPPILVYAVVFLRQLVLANIDVTYRVLAPGPPIEPEVIYVPLRVQSDVAVTTIANTITLTPGTITLDHDAEANALYVHVVDGRDLEAIVDPIRTWEDNALTIFGEDVAPATEAAQVLVTGDEARADEVVDEPAEDDAPSSATDRDDDQSSATDRDDAEHGGERGGE